MSACVGWLGRIIGKPNKMVSTTEPDNRDNGTYHEIRPTNGQRNLLIAEVIFLTRWG